METYRPSGRWSVRLVPSILVASAALAAFGYVGVALFDYVSGYWVAVAVLAGNAIATFIAASLAVSSGRCRSTTAGAVAGVVVALAGVMGGHAWSWRRAIAEHPGITKLDNVPPESFAGYFAWRLDEGYSMVARMRQGGLRSAGHFRGWPLLLAWAAEALVLAAVGRAAGRMGVTDPYCEACDAPTRRQFADIPTRREHIDRLRAARDPAELATIERSTDLGTLIVIYQLDGCTRCDRGWLTVGLRTDPKEYFHRDVTLPPERAKALRGELAKTAKA